MNKNNDAIIIHELIFLESLFINDDLIIILILTCCANCKEHLHTVKEEKHDEERYGSTQR